LQSEAQRKGDATSWKRQIVFRVLLPPVILLDGKFVVGMVEQKARRLVIILTTTGMLRSPSAHT